MKWGVVIVVFEVFKRVAIFLIVFCLTLSLSINFLNRYYFGRSMFENEFEKNIYEVEAVLGSSYMRLKVAVENFVNNPDLYNASIGFIFTDLKNDSIIISHDAHRSLVPASIVKVITTATAIRVLGPRRRFVTILEYDGTISNAVLDGNIYITGGGDPTLGSHHAPARGFFVHAANRIRQAGIDSINGNIIADARIFDMQTIPKTWTWGNINKPFGASAFGLSIFDNACIITVDPSRSGRYVLTEDMMTPYMPNMFIDNNVYITKRAKTDIYVTTTPYSNIFQVNGPVAKNSGLIRVSAIIPDPGLMAAYVLHNRLTSEENVGISGKHLTMRNFKWEYDDTIGVMNRKRLYASYSMPVSEIVRITNTYSNNLYAEHLLNHIGLRRFNRGSTFAGVDAVVEYWRKQGLNTSGFRLYDGSGLSRYNTISSYQMNQILKNIRFSSDSTIFLNSLPISGVSGTLRRFGRATPVEGRVRAKSGTMIGVRSYCGFVQTNLGRELAFTFIANNFSVPPSVVRQKFENILATVVEYY